jgi:lipopolysaccharide transport system ATP-binding protein
MNAVIELKNVSKKFRLYARPADRLKESLHPFRKRFHHEHWALKGISFSVPKGETIGIMGRNGAGKSTLLKLITSVLEPTQGEIRITGRVSALLELGAGFNPEMTGRENVLAQAALMGMTRKVMASKLPEIETFADIGEYIDQPVKTYSSGMFVRLAFAMFISVEPDILIIDEALAVGDAAFQEKCFRKLTEFKGQGKTFILVSHSAALISQLCDRVFIIEKGHVYFEGDTQAGLIKYGQLMFGTQVPDESQAALRRVVGARNVIAQLPNSGLFEGWSGRSKEGVDAFRFGPGYNKNERRSGSHKARLSDYKILVDDVEHPSASLPFGKEIFFYFRADYESEIPRPRLAVSINTLAGVLIYGANTDMAALSVPSARSGDTAIYYFSFMNSLGKGSYLVSFWLLSEEVTGIYRIDARESALIIESNGYSSFNGLVNLEAQYGCLVNREESL